ncbi:hypothetical protein DMB42_52675 [Nonomuraea sp. WAC 01424]|uniref:hypothetical protein n=1 Tax=Nonomuraea sp. WAC 01424 TaxID=2203200 RepID=UPI000F78418F|nr:hypothetical protein [Nonomuraea sp. WAC 01424]RSM93307.1 hypothetical protein DMB42_52675 [Nonomuraea sp. WAC 01424]
MALSYLFGPTCSARRPARLAENSSVTLITASSARAALPVGRVGQAEDVAQVALPATTNAFMTGQVIEVNGGLTLPTGR